MNNNNHKFGEVTADPEKVANMAQFFLEQYNAYLLENQVMLADAFMGIHAFHLIVIQNMAEQASPGIKPNEILRMADMTWRKAIRELKRQI